MATISTCVRVDRSSTTCLRGINGGADLPREYLEALYVAVVTEEIQAHDLGSGGKAGGGAMQILDTLALGWQDPIRQAVGKEMGPARHGGGAELEAFRKHKLETLTRRPVVGLENFYRPSLSFD